MGDISAAIYGRYNVYQIDLKAPIEVNVYISISLQLWQITIILVLKST